MSNMDVGAVLKTLMTPGLATAIFLIFGGCCSNVYTLEAITHRVADCGTLITFAQFLGVAIGGLLLFSLSHQGRQAVWAHKVPLIEYCKIVGFHFSVSVLNNMALAYHISVPVHIILRSGGSIVTMLLGYLFFGRVYTYRQVAAVLLVTFGVIVATTAGSPTSNKEVDEEEGLTTTFVIGLLLMVGSQFLASGTGLYLERTFRVYSPSWRETLFYTHLLALPFFVPFAKTILTQYHTLADSQPFFRSDEPLADSGSSIFNPPVLLAHLALNVFTQLVCVCGVNQLASTSTALSVSIVLNLRKFISLIISFVIFGHSIDAGVMTGAILVFMGALWYSQEATHMKDKREIKSSNVDLRSLDDSSTAKRKAFGTPMLEKGVFEDSGPHRRPSLPMSEEE